MDTLPEMNRLTVSSSEKATIDEVIARCLEPIAESPDDHATHPESVTL